MACAHGLRMRNERGDIVTPEDEREVLPDKGGIFCSGNK